MDLPENKLADLIKEDEKAKWRPVNNHNITQFTQDDIQRITRNYAKPIGKGAFGEVYLGLLDNGSRVAVKKYIQKNYNEGFAKELIVHSQINHKSVVRLLGYCTEENALMIVTEFISRGNLSNLLHISHDPIPLATRLSIAMECAEALSYMHSMYQPIIHGDIKPENILLDDKLGAKLSDFGISRLLSMDRTQYTINVIGSIGYVDPEFILKGHINPKNDVYSFGVVLLELITRKKICVNGMCTDLTENFMKVVEKGKNIRKMLDTEIMNVDWKILNQVGKLVADCLKRNLNERPDMKDVVQRLHMLTKSYHEQGKEKTTRWSLWGEQKVNQDNITTTNSNSALLYKVKVAFSSSGPETGKGKTKLSGKHVKHGYHLVKGKSNHPMEDYLVAEYRQVGEHDLGLFAIFDGHLGHTVPDFLRSHLFNNILSEPEFLSDPETAIRNAYQLTDQKILENAAELGRGGSTAVTAILIGSDKSVKLVVANVGDSRAVISKNGVAEQLSVDHEPNMERQTIEQKGGFVSNLPGDVPRVDGQLAVARAFGDRSLKKHLSSEPYVIEETIDENTDFLILASDGLWKVMSNQEAVDEIKDCKDAQAAAKHLTEQAVNRKSKDDISVIVVKFLC